MSEHWIEGIIGGVAILAAGIAAWIDLNGRVRVLERVFQDHLNEKNAIMADLGARLARFEEKLDQVALRCAAFMPYHERRSHERRHEVFPVPPAVSGEGEA